MGRAGVGRWLLLGARRVHTRRCSRGYGGSPCQVASQSWRLQGHHLDYFSGLLFTSTLADRARKSTIFLGLRENQPLSESGTWDSIRSYHPPTGYTSFFHICSQNPVTGIGVYTRTPLPFIYFYLVEILGIFASYHKSF